MHALAVGSMGMLNERNAPIAENDGDRSIRRTFMPLRWHSIAVVRPAMPAPTMRTDKGDEASEELGILWEAFYSRWF